MLSPKFRNKLSMYIIIILTKYCITVSQKKELMARKLEKRKTIFIYKYDPLFRKFFTRIQRGMKEKTLV